jgi:hypothetical protein
MYYVSETVRSLSDSNGTTLLNTSTNQMVSLNEAGTFIWNGISRGLPFSEIIQQLMTSTRVPAEIIKHDMESFLEELVERGLLYRSPGAAL